MEDKNIKKIISNRAYNILAVIPIVTQIGNILYFFLYLWFIDINSIAFALFVFFNICAIFSPLIIIVNTVQNSELIDKVNTRFHYKSSGRMLFAVCDLLIFWLPWIYIVWALLNWD